MNTPWCDDTGHNHHRGPEILCRKRRNQVCEEKRRNRESEIVDNRYGNSKEKMIRKKRIALLRGCWDVGRSRTIKQNLATQLELDEFLF